MADITMLCLECRRLSGETKPVDGKPPRKYDLYTGYFKDVLTGEVAQLTSNVIDGSAPPVVGVEYPIIFQQYRTRDGKFAFRPQLSPEYVR